MSLPAEWPIDIYKGDTFEQPFRIKDENGVYVNLTGYTGRAQLRDNSGVLAVAFTLTFANQGTEPGKVTISLTAAQTTALVIASGKYDLELTLSGKVTTFVKGVVAISADITV